VDVGSTPKQDRDDVSLARPGSHVQRRLIPRRRRFQGRRGVVKQVRHDGHVTHERGDVQRSQSGLQSTINTRPRYLSDTSITLSAKDYL